MNRLRSLFLLITVILVSFTSSAQYTMFSDIPMDESNLEGRVLTISTPPDSLEQVLLISDFILINAPPGLTILSAVQVDYHSADLTLTWAPTDFDANITDFHVDVQSTAFINGFGGGLTNTLTITALIEASTITPDSTLTEQRLDYRYIDVNLTNETFDNYATLTTTDFILHNAPIGMTLASVTGMLPTHAELYLDFDGTDFDTDVTDFYIDIEPAALSISQSFLSSNTLTILAYDEPSPAPVIQNVSIPDIPMIIGDIVVVTITVDDDQGAAFTLSSGTIGGYSLYGLARFNNTTYTCQFDITEGGTDYPAVNDIPVVNLVLDNAGTPNAAYGSNISQANDPIDANRPVITSATVTSGDNYLTIGEDLVITIATAEAGLLLDNASTVNTIPYSAANVSFTDIGGGSYTITYTVEFGDPDVLVPGNLTIDLVLLDALGNPSLPETTLLNNNVEIHSSPVAQISSDSVLSELWLDDHYIDVTLINETFPSPGTLITTNFQILNAPLGLTLESVTNAVASSVRLNLAFDGTDFEPNRFIKIQIEDAVLAQSVSPLVSIDSLELIAVIEPEIVSVSIPDAPMNVGTVADVFIVVDDDFGNTFTLSSGEIGGYTLQNLTRTDNTNYHAEFTVNEGGTDFAAGDDIPITNLVLNNAGITNAPYASLISQSGDPIDANSPVITSATYALSDSILYSGHSVKISLEAVEDGLTLHDSTKVNTIPGYSPYIFLNPLGAGIYDLYYDIQPGDPDVPAGTLPVSIIL